MIQTNKPITTKVLAEYYGVKVNTIQQHIYIHGFYRDYRPVKRLKNVRGKPYVWERK